MKAEMDGLRSDIKSLRKTVRELKVITHHNKVLQTVRYEARDTTASNTKHEALTQFGLTD